MKKNSPPFSKRTTEKKEYPASTDKQIVSKDHPAFIVVIGASAGGLHALMEMVQTLQKGLDVAYCIVLHLSRKAIGDFVLHRHLQIAAILFIGHAYTEKDIEIIQ